jgi:hypothetical protein
MLHQTARFALAQQAAKGTAAAGVTVPYIRGRMQSHGLNPRYEMIDTSGEHTGVHSRSTALQSTPIRAGSIIDVAFTHRLYPSMIGLELIGLGFTNTTATTVVLTIVAAGGTFTVTVSAQTTAPIDFDATVGEVEAAIELLSTVTAATVTGTASNYTITVDSGVTATTMTASGASLTGGANTAVYTGFYYVHTFTLAAADSESWLSAYDYLGETSGFDRVVSDIRLSQLQLSADSSGIVVSGSGLGILMADAAATETFTAEADNVLSQANGAFTLTASDITAATLGTPRAHTITIDNPLDEGEQELHTMNRATFSPTGKTVTGSLSGLVFSENIFSELYRGSASGTAAVIPIPVSTDLTWNWQSAGNISSAAAVPYKLTMDMPIVQFEGQAFDVTIGGGQLLYDCSYTMTDALSAAPITITLQNTIDSYAGT